ncbi:S-layer homology domain-containing protein, partial [Paenibacillus alvei]
KNHVGSSAYTVPVSALTLPAAVKGLSVSPIGREAFAGSVKFESSLSADQYHIAVRENDTKQLVYESTVTDATYQPIQNLKPGVNYTVTVTAENGSGRGAAASVGFLSLPDAPGQFSAIQINTDGIYLGWTSVTSATYYDLERDQSFIYGGADLFYKDTGLQSGTEYNYGVSAKNDTGYGMKSELANVITLPARTSVTATTYGTDRITLQWPSVKGAANYVVGVDGQEVGTVTAATYGTLQTYEITGLNPGMSYRFSLQPENSSGSGEETYVVAFTLPEAVTEGSVEVTDITETTAVMKWDAVPGATTYRVRIGESLYELSDTVLNLNGLQEGTSYQSIIEAGNGSGYGPGTTISFLTLPPQVGEIAAYEQGSELQLSWKPVPSAKEYIVEKNGQIVGTVSESAWKAKDLSAGESYHFSVRAVNETGEGSKTPFIWRMLPDGMEDLKVRVSDISEHSAKLSWEAAAGADGYRVYQGKKQLLQVTETNSVLDGLASGLTYKDLKIVPFNSTGETKGAKVPAFATLPSELFKVNVEAAENKLTYHFEIDSENETIVVVRDGKEVYRDKDREFVLRPLPSGVEIKVEVWAENEFGQRSKGQVIKAKTLNSSQDSNGTSSSSNGSDNSFAKDLNKKQEDLEIVNDDKSKNESAESNKDNGDIFIDIDELYNKDSILSLYERGVVKANPYKVFEPNRSVTRAEYMAMIVRALELEGKEAPPMLFRDIDKEAWYYRELQIHFLL